MIKQFCERCGKECARLTEIKIPSKKTSYGLYEIKRIPVCDDCKAAYDDINDKLVDIRLILFDKFIKGGTSDDL